MVTQRLQRGQQRGAAPGRHRQASPGEGDREVALAQLEAECSLELLPVPARGLQQGVDTRAAAVQYPGRRLAQLQDTTPRLRIGGEMQMRQFAIAWRIASSYAPSVMSPPAMCATGMRNSSAACAAANIS